MSRPRKNPSRRASFLACRLMLDEAKDDARRALHLSARTKEWTHLEAAIDRTHRTLDVVGLALATLERGLLPRRARRKATRS